MKKLSVLFLIAILGIVLWALPARAEKIRMTDAEMDGITAGASLAIPPPASVTCCAHVFLSAVGSLMPPTGSLSLVVMTLGGKTIGGVNVNLNPFGSVPGGVGVGGIIAGPKGTVVPIPGLFLPIP